MIIKLTRNRRKVCQWYLILYTGVCIQKLPRIYNIEECVRDDGLTLDIDKIGVRKKCYKS